jgi:hypothetical protein
VKVSNSRSGRLTSLYEMRLRSCDSDLASFAAPSNQRFALLHHPHGGPSLQRYETVRLPPPVTVHSKFEPKLRIANKRAPRRAAESLNLSMARKMISSPLPGPLMTRSARSFRNHQQSYARDTCKLHQQILWCRFRKTNNRINCFSSPPILILINSWIRQKQGRKALKRWSTMTSQTVAAN